MGAKIESATVGSPIRACQLATGSWLVLQRRAGLIARIADLEEVAALGFRQGSHGPIVDNEQVDAAELIEDFRVAAVGARGGEMAKQLGGFEELRN